MERQRYPSDVRNDEWSFVAPSLALMTMRTGAQWHMMLHDLPLWATVSQQRQRWLQAGVFEVIVSDVRTLSRLAQGHSTRPPATLFDCRTLQARPKSKHQAGSDGARGHKGSNVHVAVNPLGNLLTLMVPSVNEQNRAQDKAAAREVTGSHVEVPYVEQGDMGNEPAQVARGRRLQVVPWPEARRACVLLPRRWIVERCFAWTTRFRRLARVPSHWPETLASLPLLACTVRMLHRFTLAMAPYP